MIDIVYSWIIEQFHNNDVFAGVVGAGFFGSILYSLRSIPNYIYHIFIRQYTIHLEVWSDTEAFSWVDEWLSKLDATKKSRRIKLTSHYLGEEQDKTWTFGLGRGNHILKHENKYLWVERKELEGGAQGSHKVKESLSIRMLGRSQEKLRSLVDQAYNRSQNKDGVVIFTWNDYWKLSFKKLPRDPKSVILPSNQFENITNDIDKFLNSQNWYQDRGIPYHRGYLLSGPPGTGKTSIANAIASYFGMHICVLNLSSIKDDSSLQDAFWSANKASILLIEDVDAVRISNNRQENKDSEEKGITLSCLLNLIDGVSAPEGRILFMTSNHPEKLDPALIRAGRVDRHEKFGKLGYNEIQKMFYLFFPDYDGELEIPRNLTIIPAELQGIFLNNDAKSSIDKLNNYEKTD